MINVLHLINYAGKGGSEKYILSLAEKLNKKQCTFYLGYSVEGPLIVQAREIGIEAFHIPMKCPYDLRAAKMVKDICCEFSIDVLHTHFLRENFVSVLSKIIGNKAAVVNTRHMLDCGSFFVRFADSMLTMFADRLIAVSNAVKENMMSEGIDGRLIKVIYNGVDPDYWKGRRNYRIRQEFGISREDFVITSAARFTEEKGHFFLLEAVKFFRRLYTMYGKGGADRVKFILAGDGERLDECKNFAKMLGVSDSVVFVGYRSDLRNILHCSDLFVSHSKREALGLSILEALGSGLPVVATNSGGPSEIINSENYCGIIVEYGDIEGFAEALLKLATDRNLYNACRENAYKTVTKKFNLDMTAQETYNLYAECLRSGKGE